MTLEISTIALPFPLKFSAVNCFLVKNPNGYYIVDSGMTNNWKQLERELSRLGCHPGNLKMILLTHGDFDHTGNAVRLRKEYGGLIAMHQEDAGMLENGDMFYHRKFEKRWVRGLMKAVMPFKEKYRGTPEVLLKDEESLEEYGLEAMVYNTPGHSTGSVCILTAEGDLFAGDLLNNSRGQPRLNQLMYDKEQGDASLERLKTLPIRMVYPGHGKPFKWEELVK